MKINWLIEDFSTDNGFERLANEARKQGHNVVIEQYLPFASGKYDVFPNNSCTLFHGSIQMAKQIQRESNWVPGVWCNWKEMECLNYYAKCGNYLANHQYTMMPLSEVHRRHKELFELFGGSFFCRPNDGAKSFTGLLLHFDCYEKNVLWQWVLSEIPSTTLVIVAAPINIHKEWRVVVAEGETITSSLYKENDCINVQHGSNASVENLAEIIAYNLEPSDPLLIVDICEIQGELKLLEIGAFSVAGLYALDVSKIVDCVTTFAIKEHKDIWDS